MCGCMTVCVFVYGCVYTCLSDHVYMCVCVCGACVHHTHGVLVLHHYSDKLTGSISMRGSNCLCVYVNRHFDESVYVYTWEYIYFTCLGVCLCV